MERPASISSSAKQPKSDEENDEEDYSASASAIISRVSAGGRRRAANRRASSHSPEFGLPSCNRRRSSVFTTSSAETGVSAEEGTGTGMGAEAGVGAETSQEQMYENMRLHKEVLNGVRLQPWPMRRKLWLVKQAKLFLSKHEGQLQERLAQSKRTKDLLARFNIFFTKQWQNSKRELANLMNILIPWELRIKEIESHFGSAVASYFTFLRWLFWVNLVISILLIAFVAVPEVVLVNHRNTDTSERKTMLPEEEANSTSFETLWNFEGVLKYSPLFYGYYSNRDEDTQQGYRLPMAYFLTGIGVYVYSFIATLRRMAVNSRQSKLSEKEDECVFTWKLFTGWDYMIGNAETAHNRTSSIILSFKEALLEEAEKKREDLR
nr:PREDICTED: transmembrane channel-like protein 3 [Bemisia tabaci]